MRNFVLILASLLALFATACQRTRIAPAYEPCHMQVDIPQDTSFLSTPLVIPTHLIEDKINTAIKKDFIKDDNFDNISKKTGKRDRLKMLVSRKQDIKIDWKDNVATCSAPLAVLIEREVLDKGILNKGMALKTAFDVRLSFDISLDVDSDWRLRTKTNFKEFHWLSDVRTLGGLINLKKPVEKRLKAEMPNIEKTIDSLVYAQVRLDRTVERIWQKMQKPIALNKKHRVAWLQIQPIRFEIGRISTQKDELLIQSRIQAVTKTLVGENPKYRVDSILPPLKRFARLPDTAYVYMLSEVPYGHISDMLLEKFEHKKLNVQGHTLKVKDIRVWGCGERLTVHLKVGGDVDGDLYLQGKPVYEESGNLVIHNFEFDLNTQEALLKSASWLLHGTLRDEIQKVLTLPLGEKISNLPEKIEQGIEKGKLGRKLDLNIEEWTFKPEKIWMQEDHLAVLVTTQAQVRVLLEQL